MKNLFFAIPFAILIVILTAILCLDAAQDLEQGRSLDWTRSQKLAATYFFYWYDIYTGYHIWWEDGGDQLQEHPPKSRMNNYSYADPAWHRQELLDMIAAKIDIVLPVFWWDNSNRFWSFAGLSNLVAASQQLIAEGRKPPKIGMFCDMTSLCVQNGNVRPDLTTQKGKNSFYENIADFFRRVPGELRAMIDGSPIIFLYLSSYVRRYNQGTFEYINKRFAEEFGNKPYIVREESWVGVETEGKYRWGVALVGPKVFNQVGSLGPGYNETATRRPNPYIRDRESGEFYKSSWETVINSGAKLVAIETWNEWHEGTDIAPSREYGKTYLNLTAKYIDRWKRTNFGEESLVWIDLGRDSYMYGLSPVAVEDGTWSVKTLGKKEAAYPDTSKFKDSHYIYFKINNEFADAANHQYWVTVEYFDGGTGIWGLDYDGILGAFTAAPSVSLYNTGQWKRHTFHLTDAQFEGRQHEGADFRLADLTWIDNESDYFGRVWVSKSALGNEAPDLEEFGDQTVLSGTIRKIPLSASDADGDDINLIIDTKYDFLKLVSQDEGKMFLQISPKAKHKRSIPYHIVILAKDTGTPSLADAIKFRIRVN